MSLPATLPRPGRTAVTREVHADRQRPGPIPLTARSHAEVSALFDGLDVPGPGVV
ncbi:MAG TPA: hypothetical protein VFV73_26800 [Streptosporangiaceae bacterium]|nr:hypothetical protein [Streptosporangiaceae bacterium]